MVENEFDVWYSTLNSKQKKILERFSFGLIAVGKKRGRVEGAIKELKIIIKRNSNFKYSRLDMIEFCEKRLKELESKGVN